MSRYFTEAESVSTVLSRTSSAADPRLREVIASLVEHLHAFAKEVSLTESEWDVAISFLTQTGQISSGERQEFILLSDVFGLSMLVDTINHRRPAAATESTVLGPFHVEGAPIREMGDNICLDGKGESCTFTGRILDLDGLPISGAVVDVWSDNADGLYDVQQPGIQPKWNNRGRFVTNTDGQYEFVGIKPKPYSIPDDGPVGLLLDRLGRHPYRPAHLHYLITAPGHQRLVTHTFAESDEYLESDAVFGVRESLVANYEQYEDGPTRWRCEFDFALAPNTDESRTRQTL